MLRMAVTGDSHLGKIYQTMEFREEDIKRGFDMFLSSIVSDKPDVVVHAGDLFDRYFPPGWIFDLALERLQAIPGPTDGVRVVDESTGGTAPNVFMVHGNHDGISDPKSTTGYFSVLKYFDSMSLCNYLDLRVEEDNVYLPRFVIRAQGVSVGVQGLGYRSPSQFENLLDEIQAPDDADYNVLLVHQAIAELTTTYTKGESIPQERFLGKGFDLVIAGHIHRPMYDENDGTRFLVPGSTERIDSGEYGDRKGYYVVNFTKEGIESEFRAVDLDQIRKIRTYIVDVEGLSGSEITKQCVEAVTDPNIEQALIYFVLRGQTPRGHLDVSKDEIERELIDRGARAVKVNTDRVIRKEIGQILEADDWRHIRITESLFQRLLAQVAVKDLEGKPIREEENVAFLSKIAYRIFRAYEEGDKSAVESVLDKDLLALAEALHKDAKGDQI